VYTYPVRKIRSFYRSECTKIVCRLATLAPAEGAFSAPPDPLAAFGGPTSKRGEGKGGEKKEGKKGGKKREGEVRGNATHPYEKFLATPLLELKSTSIKFNVDDLVPATNLIGFRSDGPVVLPL